MPAANRPMGFSHPGMTSLRTPPNHSGFEAPLWLEIPDFRVAETQPRPIAPEPSPVMVSTPAPLPEPVAAEPVAVSPPSEPGPASEPLPIPLEPRVPVSEALASVKPRISPVALVSALAITGVLLVLLLMREDKSELGADSATQEMADFSEAQLPGPAAPRTNSEPSAPPPKWSGAPESPRLADASRADESTTMQWPPSDSELDGPHLSEPDRQQPQAESNSSGWPAPQAPAAGAESEPETEPFPRPATADPLYEARLRGPATGTRAAEFEGTILKPRGEWR